MTGTLKSSKCVTLYTVLIRLYVCNCAHSVQYDDATATSRIAYIAMGRFVDTHFKIFEFQQITAEVARYQI